MDCRNKQREVLGSGDIFVRWADLYSMLCYCGFLCAYFYQVGFQFFFNIKFVLEEVELNSLMLARFWLVILYIFLTFPLNNINNVFNSMKKLLPKAGVRVGSVPAVVRHIFQLARCGCKLRETPQTPNTN